MHFKLSIPEPCHEDWLQMTPAAQGRFCASCKKEVIDFTQLSRKQIADKVKSGNTFCGRYRKDQLETTYFIPEQKPLRNLGIAAAFTSLLALCEPVQAQENKTESHFIENDGRNDHLFISSEDSHIFYGTVYDQFDTPLIGVKIMLEGTEISTQTDFDGKFKLKIPKKVYLIHNSISCNYLGFEKTIVSLNDFKDKPVIKLEMTEVLTGEVVIFRSLNSKTKKPRSKYQ